jgi:hypothetical protein
LWSSPYERQGEDTVSDDTDKAARDAAWQQCLSRHNYDDHLNVTDISLLHDGFDFGWEAGASHALSRPLSEEEAIQMGTEINQAFADHRGSPTGTELARAAYSALQRMRTKG